MCATVIKMLNILIRVEHSAWADAVCGVSGMWEAETFHFGGLFEEKIESLF